MREPAQDSKKRWEKIILIPWNALTIAHLYWTTLEKILGIKPPELAD
jgi:hypothetical protein